MTEERRTATRTDTAITKIEDATYEIIRENEVSIPAPVVEPKTCPDCGQTYAYIHINCKGKSVIPEVPPPTEETIDFGKLRDLMFSIRDQGIYCPWCRCPEWSSNEMRVSHFEECPLGLMCEKLLRMYPKEGASVKWRK